MNILIYGLTERRGRPLSTVLRYYGQHSVVGYPDPQTGREHPDPAVNELEQRLPTPIAPSLADALDYGSGLVIIAGPPALARLDALQREWTTRKPPSLLPVVIATYRHPPPAHWPGLAVGWAPFSYRVEHAVDRLLTLPRIQVLRLDRGPQGLLHAAVSEAWRWVDNKIRIVETPRWEPNR